ncbi:MAG: HD domain-containing protein [Pseudomonadota bacterium]
MDRETLFQQAKALAQDRVTPDMDLDQKVDVLEHAMAEVLDVQVMKPFAGRVTATVTGSMERATGRWLMGDDPRLEPMPAKPTLIDFFRHRFLKDKVGGTHLLQSAKLARDKGLSDNTVLACLLHDISVIGLIRNDHGHWAAQMVEPYVDAEVAWAIKHHQALRFRPDPDYGYDYPAFYTEVFGKDYDPPDYIKAEWDYCRNHKWFDSAMQVVVNDLYAFDPNMTVSIEDFEDVIARAFCQPDEGLGFDQSPVAHMWRSVIWPNNFL